MSHVKIANFDEVLLRRRGLLQVANDPVANDHVYGTLNRARAPAGEQLAAGAARAECKHHRDQSQCGPEPEHHRDW